MSYAQNIQDATLDRSYEYDHVGRLVISHSGAEARAHVGTPGAQWGTMDGPYSQGYDYDVWGNVTHKYGWGGEVQGGTAGQNGPDINRSYTNNRVSIFGYDAAGNLTNDLGQTFTYDATGQQATASYGGYSLTQSYDGDGLRVKKNDNGAQTYYLRSSVLGGQVVAEIIWASVSWQWNRGYVYLGSQLLAVQQAGVYWIHEDPVTKSKRVTNSAGAIVSTVELDPWGADTNRSSNGAFQPKKFTTYERDANGTDEAMFRRYNRWQSRFDQPDPYDGSYSLTNPQSFNRYAYVQGDPVNFVDPTGLDKDGVWVTDPATGQPYFIPGFAFGVTVNIGGWNGSFGGSGAEHEWQGANPWADALPKRLWGPQKGNQQKSLDDKEIKRRIAEGQAWDKWAAWVNCNTPIMDKYNGQIKDFLKIGGEAFWWEVGAGIAAGTAVFGTGTGKIGGNAGTGTEGDWGDGGPVLGVWGVVLIAVGVHVAERKRINNIKAEYQKEVTSSCGAKPRHP